MGTFRVPIEIGDRAGRRYERQVHAPSSGDPRSAWGAPPEGRRFILADQREAVYQTAWVMAKIDGDAQPTIIVFGEPGYDPLLGAVTLRLGG